MAGRQAAQLAEALELVKGDGGPAGARVLDLRKVEESVEQRRGVARREDEAVAVGPARVVGVESQDVAPQGVADRGQAHGRAGVAGGGGLDGVHGQGADRIDAQAGRRVRKIHDAPFFRGWRGEVYHFILGEGIRGPH
jgi:hypothetical protein